MVSEEKYEQLVDKCVRKDKFIRHLGHVLRGCRCGIVTRVLLEELCLVESQLEKTDYTPLAETLVHGHTHIRLQGGSGSSPLKPSLTSTTTWTHSVLGSLSDQLTNKPDESIHRQLSEVYTQTANMDDPQFVHVADSRYPNQQSVSGQFLSQELTHDSSYTPEANALTSQYVPQVVSLSESEQFADRVHMSGDGDAGHVHVDVADAYAVSQTLGREGQHVKGDEREHIYLQHSVDSQFTPDSPHVDTVDSEPGDMYVAHRTEPGHFMHSSDHRDRFLQHQQPENENMLNNNDQSVRCITQQGTDTGILLNASGESEQYVEHDTNESSNQVVTVQHSDQNDQYAGRSNTEHSNILNNLTDFAYQNFVQFPAVSQSEASPDILNLQAQVVSMQMSDNQVQHVAACKPYESQPSTDEKPKSSVLRKDSIKCRKPSNRSDSIGMFQVTKHRCDVCGKGFAKLSKLNEHVRVHTGEKPFKCMTCQKCFAQSGTLKYHMRIHSGERPFTCSDCGKTFTQPGQLSSHQLIHREKSFKCHLCKKSFPEELLLERHVKIHKKERPHRCDKCGKCFLHQGNLEMHKQKCLVSDDDLKCRDCGQVLPSYDELKEHDMSHSKDKPHQCDICLKRFKRHLRLAKHQNMHAGVKKERSHMCEVCGQCYCKPSLLKIHMRVHSGEKPFMCDFCGKFLGSANNLRRHVLSHTGERNFKCKECGKDFSTSHNLEYHSRIHSGLKPFKCDLCGKGFPFSFSLDRHMRTHNKRCRT